MAIVVVLPVLYLLAGLPCSGKSTYARDLESTGVVRVSVDDMVIAAHGRLGVDYEAESHLQLLGPIVAEARTLVTATLRRGSSVVLDHGLGMQHERNEWKRLATAANASWELLRFHADLATLRARCMLRSSVAGAIQITDDTLRAMASNWEPPDGEGEECVDTTADWAKDFYSMTDQWWGDAESVAHDVGRMRAGWLQHLAESDVIPSGGSVLELGCGSGSTAAAVAAAGFDVTGIDFSDRIDRAAPEPVKLVKADFYEHDFDRRFDVVVYWDGFGVSTDADHVRLVDRIASNLVQPDGLVAIEVFDPIGWRADDGLHEVKYADPSRGYHQSLAHCRVFDETHQRAVDAWREVDDDRIWSQSLRCYSPEDFTALVGSSRLELDRISRFARTDWSYLAVLRVR